MVVLPFLAMFFMALKGFIYTFVVDFYAFRLAFSTILQCILHQNALRLAAKRIVFSSKLHYVLLKIAQNMVQMAVPYNKDSFCRIRMLTPLGIKTNLRENRFFAARWAVGGQKGHSSC